jgi:hypothetical protein
VGGVPLHAGARPRGDGAEARPVGRELEQRAPVGAREFDEFTEAALDLLVDAFHGPVKRVERSIRRRSAPLLSLSGAMPRGSVPESNPRYFTAPHDI